MAQQHPLLAPIYAPGSEPYPPGTTQEEKDEVRKVQKWTNQMNMVMESCPTKVVMAGGMGESSDYMQEVPEGPLVGAMQNMLLLLQAIWQATVMRLDVALPRPIELHSLEEGKPPRAEARW